MTPNQCDRLVEALERQAEATLTLAATQAAMVQQLSQVVDECCSMADACLNMASLLTGDADSQDDGAVALDMAGRPVLTYD